MPYNYGKAAGLTDIEAGRALDMTKQTGGVHDLTTQRRQGLQRIQQLFPGEAYVENPRFGGLMTPDQGVGSGPRQSFVTQGAAPPGTPPGQPLEGTLRQLPPRAPIPTTVPTPATSLLDDAIAMLGKIARGGLRFVSSAPVAGALGGYGAVSNAEEAINRVEAKDVPGAAIAGAGTLGGLAALLPFRPLRSAGNITSAASPLALMALDRARKVRAEPTLTPTPEEMQEAQRPSFMTARP
jgi:hypothetical protein